MTIKPSYIVTDMDLEPTYDPQGDGDRIDFSTEKARRLKPRGSGSPIPRAMMPKSGSGGSPTSSASHRSIRSSRP